jgi:protein TonB
MNVNLSFSSGLLTAAIFLAAVVVVGTILALRTYLRTKENQNLSEKYKGKQWKSPLEARVKYPDVDAFQYRSSILRMSLAIVLALIIFAFNWTTYDKASDYEAYNFVLDEEISIEPPRSKELPPPPPPPPPPAVAEVTIVENMEDEDDIEFADQSIEAETMVDAPPVVSDKPAPPPPPPPKMEEPKVEEIFKIVEQMPRFPGCESIGGDNSARAECANKKLMEFIYSNIQYPAIARENNVEGTVVIQFVVDTDGSITDAKIVRDIGAQCGEEALRIVELMNHMPEKWTPGKQRGRAVKVLYMLPVKFKLL